MKARWAWQGSIFGQSEAALFSHPKQALATTSLPLAGSPARASRVLSSWLVWVAAQMVIRGRDFLQERGQLPAACLQGPACQLAQAWRVGTSWQLTLPMCDSPTFSGDVPGSTHHNLPKLLSVPTSSSLCRWRVSCNLENFILFFLKLFSP